MAKNSGAINAVVGLDGSRFNTGVEGILQKLGLMKENLSSASSSMQKFGQSTADQALKARLLSDQITLQNTKMAKLTSAFAESVKTKGLDSEATQKIAVQMDKVDIAMAKLNTSVTNTDKAITKQGDSWKTNASKASDSTKSLGDHFSAAKDIAIGFGATLLGGLGLTAVMQTSITAATSINDLALKMGIGTDQAQKLANIMTVTDTNSQPVISTMARLDKAVEGAGVKGNVTTKAMKEFGVSLSDAKGKLLPMTAQVQALADGYEKSAKNGTTTAYVAQVLGARGAALVPMLAEYAAAKAKAAAIPSIGTPTEIKELVDMGKEQTVLQKTVKDLGVEMTTALLPIAVVVFPKLLSAVLALSNYLETHKKTIQDYTTAIVNVGDMIITKVSPAVTGLMNFVVNHGKLVSDLVVGIGSAFMAYKLVVVPMMAVYKAIGFITTASEALAVKTGILKVVTGEAAVAQGVEDGALVAGDLAMLPVIATVGLVVAALVILGLGIYEIVKHWQGFCAALGLGCKDTGNNIAALNSKTKVQMDGMNATIDKATGNSAKDLGSLGAACPPVGKKFVDFNATVASNSANVSNNIQNSVNKSNKALGTLGASGATTSKSLTDGLSSGMTGTSSANVTAASDTLVAKIKQSFTKKTGFDIHSPSVWAKNISGHIGTGFMNGLTGSNILSFIKNLIADIKGVFGSIKGIGGNVIETLFNGGGDISGWISAGLAAAGEPANWAPGIMQIIGRESGGNANSISSVSNGGAYAHGIMQMMPSTFSAHMVGGLNSIMNPIDNIASAARYIQGEYGSPFNIPNLGTSAYKGYFNGTQNAAVGGAWVGEKGPEWLGFKGGESVTPLNQITAAMQKLNAGGSTSNTNNKNNNVHIDKVIVQNAGDQARSLQMLDFLSAF